MATRRIITKEDPSLYKRCREVTNFGPRLHQLFDDMKDTLSESNGVGLAAPQVGVLRRAVIVLETNVPEGEEEYFIELVNPELVEVSGEQRGPEGCLSVPGEYGIVTRPMEARIKAQDRFGNPFEVRGEGLTARAFCHEVDHLEGIVFTELAERMLTEEELESGELFDDMEDGENEEN
ncbi:MAG: peptide deformylase [Clostridia bacterium]|nr:peptide deformylase [Clostridia bacterium]